MGLSLRQPIFQQKAMRSLLRWMTLMATTEMRQARLRMMEYRHQVTATIMYDHLPINDSGLCLSLDSGS